jgi:diguanylate cyclase (GGDEF)-like protein/PAS domain S-box-containing protein
VKEVNQRKQSFKGWVNTNDELVFMIDCQGIIVRANQPWIEFCIENELPEGLWMVGASYYEQASKAGKMNELLYAKQVLNQEIEDYQGFSLISSPNGPTQWFSVKIRPIIRVNSQLYGAMIFLKPVTLHAVQPITAENVLESMTAGFCLLDNQFHINYINEIGERMLQCRREEGIGRSLWEVFPEAIDTLFYQKYHLALTEKVTVEIEEFYEPLNKWLSVKVSPLEMGGLALFFQDISERKQSEEKLKQYAYYDFLTGLPNRRLMMIKGQSLMEKREKFTAIYVNIDNMKFLNARHSFDAGNKIMVSVARKLSTLQNEHCEVGRLDGDEFGLIYRPAKGERLEGFANKVKALFDEPFILDEHHTVNISASIGIACYPYDSSKLQELISFAETAMFAAKSDRGTSYKFFRPIMKEKRKRRQKIEEGLMGDLSGSGFYFAIQPQIDGTTGKLVGIEVLSRWNHPEFGELSPLEFIEIAEQSATIVSLTHQLLRSVFEKIKEWTAQYGWNIPTAINMTPSLLADSAFFKDFFELMDQYEISPELIEIEITEQAELTYSERTLENLMLCRSKGISIAIDDFGTGFSMISYLTQFPINKIKIDKHFIQKIGQDKKSEAVLSSLIHLANSIECELLAEGIEREEEVEFLIANNCTIFQGYLYDKPLKVTDFENKYLIDGHQFSIE